MAKASSPTTTVKVTLKPHKGLLHTQEKFPNATVYRRFGWLEVRWRTQEEGHLAVHSKSWPAGDIQSCETEEEYA